MVNCVASMLHQCNENVQNLVMMTPTSDSEESQMLVTLGWSELHYATEKQDLDYVKELFRKDANLNGCDRVGRTPLSIASSKGNIEFVKWLLEHGAKVNSGFPLHYAAEKGHVDIIEYLIKNGGDVNLVKDYSYPLIIAAANNQLEVAKILIQSGANINAVNEIRVTALHAACLDGSPEMITFLIDSGCDVHAKDAFGNTPLQVCLSYNEHQPELVKLLVEKGARIDVVNRQGQTFLHDCGNPPTALELIKYGLNINARDSGGETPLFSMIHLDILECVETLLDNNADPNIPADGGMTPLHLAAKSGNVELVKQLLQKDAYVNAATSRNILPLHLAVKGNHLEVVKVLLDHGSLTDVCTTDIPYVNSDEIRLDLHGSETPLSLAKKFNHHAVAQLIESYNKNSNSKLNAEIKNKTSTELGNDLIETIKAMSVDDETVAMRNLVGWTLLHRFVANGCYKMCSELILKGLSVNALDYYERTPLCIAAFRNDIKIMRLLIENGADVNLGLPLHYAMLSGAIEAMLELIKFKCDINIKNDTYRKDSALTEAALERKSSVVKVLIENGADPNDTNALKETALHTACQFNDLESVRLLIKHGTKINSPDNCQNIALMYAASNSEYKIAKLLLANGADVNWKNNSHWTPLHRAVSKGQIKTTLELIKAGGDVNYFNGDVESPLYIAVKNPKMVKLLLDNKADVNFEAFGGWSPLHESVYEGNLKSVQELLDHGAKVNLGSAENVLPIYLAAIYGYCEIVEELLKRGSYVNPRILDLGVTRTEQVYFPIETIRKIIPGNTPWIGAALRDELDVMKVLHSFGADVNACNANGETALHLAVMAESVDVVQFLVDLKVNTNAKNCDEKTALDLAKEYDIEEIVNILDK